VVTICDHLLFFAGVQLKQEILGEAVTVTLDRLIKSSNLDQESSRIGDASFGSSRASAAVRAG
jgi:hypothetical protein